MEEPFVSFDNIICGIRQINNITEFDTVKTLIDNNSSPFFVMYNSVKILFTCSDDQLYGQVVMLLNKWANETDRAKAIAQKDYPNINLYSHMSEGKLLRLVKRNQPADNMPIAGFIPMDDTESAVYAIFDEKGCSTDSFEHGNCIVCSQAVLPMSKSAMSIVAHALLM